MNKHCQQGFAIVVFLALAAQIGFPQATSNGEDPYGERAVAVALAIRGITESSTEKALNRMGDRAALGLVKVLGEESPTEPRQVRQVLSILRQAFGAPRIIERAEDREPKATLFLLKWLRGLPAAKDMGKDIEQTKA